MDNSTTHFLIGGDFLPGLEISHLLELSPEITPVEATEEFIAVLAGPGNLIEQGSSLLALFQQATPEDPIDKQTRDTNIYETIRLINEQCTELLALSGTMLLRCNGDSNLLEIFLRDILQGRGLSYLYFPGSLAKTLQGYSSYLLYYDLKLMNTSGAAFNAGPLVTRIDMLANGHYLSAGLLISEMGILQQKMVAFDIIGACLEVKSSYLNSQGKDPVSPAVSALTSSAMELFIYTTVITSLLGYNLEKSLVPLCNRILK